MVKQIPLTQGQYALVDNEDFEFLNQFKWTTAIRKTTNYAVRAVKIEGKRTAVLMHRYITHAPKGLQVDHINGNGLDNRKNNLRIVSVRQNAQNRQSKTVSQYPGVSYHAKYGNWVSQIAINGKRHWLGSFKFEKDAFNAYKKAVHELTEEQLVCELGTVKEEG